jgi:hypothetical protein
VDPGKSWGYTTDDGVVRNGILRMLCYKGTVEQQPGGMAVKQRRLPKIDYYLDESDPDIAVLRRQDGAFVAAFSSQGATKEGISEAAEEDYLRVLQEVAQGRVEVYHRR